MGRTRNIDTRFGSGCVASYVGRTRVRMKNPNFRDGHYIKNKNPQRSASLSPLDNFHETLILLVCSWSLKDHHKSVLVILKKVLTLEDSLKKREPLDPKPHQPLALLCGIKSQTWWLVS